MQSLTPKQQLKKILKSYKEGHKLSKEYLKRRGVVVRGSGYLTHLQIDDMKGAISSSIILPIRDVRGEVVGCEVRAISPLNKNRYSKILLDTTVIYNIDKHYKERRVALTEGIIDCETLESVGVKAISALSASVRTDALHYMAIFFAEIVVVFDSDSSGVEGAKKVKKFYKKNYPDIVVKIAHLKDYDKKAKDVNEMKKKNLEKLRRAF